MQKTFGEKLQEKLDDAGIKAAELSRRSGVSKQNIGRLLNNTPHSVTEALPKPEKPTVEKLARALDWDLDDALLSAGFAPENSTLPKKPTNVMEFFEILDYLGLDVQFAGGMKMLETLGEEDLQELLDGIVANASAKVKRKMQGKK